MLSTEQVMVSCAQKYKVKHPNQAQVSSATLRTRQQFCAVEGASCKSPDATARCAMFWNATQKLAKTRMQD